MSLSLRAKTKESIIMAVKFCYCIYFTLEMAILGHCSLSYSGREQTTNGCLSTLVLIGQCLNLLRKVHVPVLMRFNIQCDRGGK